MRIYTCLLATAVLPLSAVSAQEAQPSDAAAQKQETRAEVKEPKTRRVCTRRERTGSRLGGGRRCRTVIIEEMAMDDDEQQADSAA